MDCYCTIQLQIEILCHFRVLSSMCPLIPAVLEPCAVIPFLLYRCLHLCHLLHSFSLLCPGQQGSEERTDTQTHHTHRKADPLIV